MAHRSGAGSGINPFAGMAGVVVYELEKRYGEGHPSRSPCLKAPQTVRLAAPPATRGCLPQECPPSSEKRESARPRPGVNQSRETQHVCHHRIHRSGGLRHWRLRHGRRTHRRPVPAPGTADDRWRRLRRVHRGQPRQGPEGCHGGHPRRLQGLQIHQGALPVGHGHALRHPHQGPERGPDGHRERCRTAREQPAVHPLPRTAGRPPSHRVRHRLSADDDFRQPQCPGNREPDGQRNGNPPP